MIWGGIVFVAIAGVAIIVAKRPLADMQAALAGGTMTPGCVVAEGVLLLVIAAALVIAHTSGLFAE